MNDNIKISLFCYNKYKILLCCGHKIKVCAECSGFSIGFRHKQLKYNTWKPGTKIVLHSVIISWRPHYPPITKSGGGVQFNSYCFYSPPLSKVHYRRAYPPNNTIYAYGSVGDVPGNVRGECTDTVPQ